MMDSTYNEPTALIVLSGIFLLLGAIFALVVVADMLWRQAWKSMMLIMIPTYIINATFMGPLTLFLYFRYGRPAKPEKQSHTHDPESEAAKKLDEPSSSQEEHGFGAEHHQGHEQHDHHAMAHDSIPNGHSEHSGHDAHAGHEAHETHNGHDAHKMPMDHAHMHGDLSSRPIWATVLIGVSHCGAGCVLGDLVGEWLVYGTGATINGADVWPCLLIDYGFALLFGIVFQYFSIAPMSGEYGLRTVWRAAKADFLSLTFFEIGLFGWMVAYQVGIWNYNLMMTTWTYWWMMQVGMILGFVTAVPINWWLITKGIKEPCA